MRARVTVLLFLAACLLPARAGGPGYKTFYLGLQPQVKVRIIKDLMSAEGKLYQVGRDSVLVKDNPEVLGRIEDFLSQKDIALKDQVRVTLRRKETGRSERLDSDLGFQVEGGKGPVTWKGGTGGKKTGRPGRDVSVDVEGDGGSVTWTGGTETRKTSGSKDISVIALSGEPAEIRLEASEERILAFRRRFLALERVTTDGEVLAVKPTVSGKLIHLAVESRYVAQVDGKRESFATGELQTQVVLRPGVWLDVGGSLSSGSDRTRRNVVLGVEDKDTESDLSFSVMAEQVGLE